MSLQLFSDSVNTVPTKTNITVMSFLKFYMLISWLVCSLYVLMNIVKSISFLCIRTIYESLLIYSSFLYMLVNLHVAQFCLRSQHSLLNALTYSHLINLSTEKNITLFFSLGINCRTEHIE